MCGLRNSAILFLLVLFHMNLYGDTQLIGEEKKYVFLEQAVLERVRSTLLEITNTLEARVGSLEEDNKRIVSELNSLKNVNPIKPAPEAVIGCPLSDNCAVFGLECPRIFMDPATLFTRFLSRDKLTMSNRQVDNTYEGQTRGDLNRVYEGVQGSIGITNRQKMYFETDIYYRIEKDLSATNLVFEVAFATEKAIAKSHYVGRQNEAWSINAHNSFNQGVTLFFKSNGGSIGHSEILSDATSGTERYLKLGFFINRVDRTIAVFDINMNRKIYTFTNVDGSQELWPVFGVYQATKTFVRFRLNTASDITSVPCGLF
ncbi:uncharacterized protein LOC110465253 [Mizuhopecten yessoensis]|uniref:Uncharacterized protein n=1 Tax=Mizuhopecten yessoensis TaxID=6573 RepID=A0A210PS38_MIZYE|nr:uncharacterized protein LOC110465253 [Mizuhopecten yessoensis]OWF39266.1 hypothetical protein KP79_PYT20728 [Mizuhopecten yessoensis]